MMVNFSGCGKMWTVVRHHKQHCETFCKRVCKTPILTFNKKAKPQPWAGWGFNKFFAQWTMSIAGLLDKTHDSIYSLIVQTFLQ
jgi:hypothetical protein